MHLNFVSTILMRMSCKFKFTHELIILNSFQNIIHVDFTKTSTNLRLASNTNTNASTSVYILSGTLHTRRCFNQKRWNGKRRTFSEFLSSSVSFPVARRLLHNGRPWRWVTFIWPIPHQIRADPYCNRTILSFKVNLYFKYQFSINIIRIRKFPD